MQIEIVQGAAFSATFAVGATYDGWSAVAALWSDFTGNGASCGQKLVDFTVSAIASGNVTISLTAAQTAAIVVPPYFDARQRIGFLGFWDIFADNGGDPVRIAADEATFSRTVSRGT